MANLAARISAVDVLNYKDSASNRNYTKTPHFGLQRMEDDARLQDYANVIESAVCQFDEKQNGNINDNIALRLIELLIDKYFFNDNDLNFENSLKESGFNLVDRAIRKKLKNISSEELSKTLGTMHRSIKRHTNGHREYINFIHQHVGIEILEGVRAIRNFRLPA